MQRSLVLWLPTPNARHYRAAERHWPKYESRAAAAPLHVVVRQIHCDCALSFLLSLALLPLLSLLAAQLIICFLNLSTQSRVALRLRDSQPMLLRTVSFDNLGFLFPAIPCSVVQRLFLD